VVASDCLIVIDMEKPFEGRYSMIIREIKSKKLEYNTPSYPYYSSLI
jgi:hypothetical protein